MFNDDEWIRSSTEAETITAHIPQEHVTYAAQDATSGGIGVTSKICATHSDGRLRAKVRVKTARGAQCKKLLH